MKDILFVLYMVGTVDFAYFLVKKVPGPTIRVSTFIGILCFMWLWPLLAIPAVIEGLIRRMRK